MAITFRGSIGSPVALGNNATTENIFVIENGYASRVNLILRRVAVQCDAIAAYTAVQAIARSKRTTGLSSGGVLLIDKGEFDTSQSSDVNVIIRAAMGEAFPVAVSVGDTVWQQYVNRMHTTAEQQQGTDQNAIPMLCAESGYEFILRPGQGLAVQIIAAAAAANPVTNNYFVTCAWEEDSLTTFSIGGTVSLSGSPVSGARVLVMEADDHNYTNPRLVEVKTTGAPGTWSSSIKTGCVGFAYVQYDNSGTLYTAPGSPFLEP